MESRMYYPSVYAQFLLRFLFQLTCVVSALLSFTRLLVLLHDKTQVALFIVIIIIIPTYSIK